MACYDLSQSRWGVFLTGFLSAFDILDFGVLLFAQSALFGWDGLIWNVYDFGKCERARFDGGLFSA